MSTRKHDEPTKYEILIAAAKDNQAGKIALHAMNSSTADRAVIAIINYCLRRLGWPDPEKNNPDFVVHPKPMMHWSAFSGTVEVIFPAVGRLQFAVEYNALEQGNSITFGSKPVTINGRKDLVEAADVLYEALKSQLDS